MKKLILNILFVGFALIVFKPACVLAADFTSDYEIKYTLSDSNNTVNSLVNFNVKITHNRSDVFVQKFALFFPNVFPIKNIEARDDNGPITPELTDENNMLKISLEFSNPATGKGSSNNFFIQFEQDNLFRINGNVWEVILPTIEDRSDGTYQVTVVLPKNSDKKLSVAKPAPNIIRKDELIWNNPGTKTIYAIFGDTQYYKTELTYNLKNTKVVPIYTDIAFPPDTLHQEIFVNKITPQPEKVFIDTDGNWLARYKLKPKEEKTVTFDGIIGIYSKSRNDYKQILDNQISKEKKYLLTAKDYWKILSFDKYSHLKTVSDIYNFLVSSFTYDYSKITKNTGRSGAEKALANPTSVVCTEFTDSFIALTREQGIYSREIQGYGFSSDSRLRPISLASDLLHAWPEYYDSRLKTWIQVDPTWQNTSGIDYFSSFDLNHIAFVIHGQDPRYPYPAGTYKTTDSKDVLIEAVAFLPEKKIITDIVTTEFGPVVYDQKKYELKLTFKNQSNVFLYNQKIPLSYGNGLSLDSRVIAIDQIAPLEEREIIISFTTKKTLRKIKSYIKGVYNDREVLNKQISILPSYYNLAFKFGYITIFLLAVSILIFYAKRKSS